MLYAFNKKSKYFLGARKMRTVKTIQMRCGQAYVVSPGTEDGLLELGDVFLPRENEHGTRPYRFSDFNNADDAEKRVMTICTLLGCCGSCIFCSVKDSFKRILTADEIVGQVDFLLEQGKLFGRAESPMESRDFHVLYSRMGEPTFNMRNVLSSVYTLAARYPHVRIGMSTIGCRGNAVKFLEHPQIAPHLMLQFSTHGTDEESRSRILGIRTGGALMTLEEIALFCRLFRRLNPRKISLNFVLLKGQKYDFKRLRGMFRPEDIYLRLSPLNVTLNSKDTGLTGLLREKDVLQKAPVSSDELRSVIADIEESGFAYAYAPAIDEEIRNQAACGQALEMLRKEKLSTFEQHELMGAAQYAQI